MTLFQTAMDIAKSHGESALHEWFASLSLEDQKQLKTELHEHIQPFVEIFGRFAVSAENAARQMNVLFQQLQPLEYKRIQRIERNRRRYKRRYERGPAK